MDLIELSAVELSGKLARREVSAREVLAAYLDRIEAVNPAVNALVDVRPELALEAASAIDDATEPPGPLAGLPLGIKDLAAARGFRFTQGSPIFADTVATDDDPVVARLRAAGAVIVGKTNTPEFGLGSHTFNQVYGVTRNPYDLGRTAGGSSGGAAAALAARMLPIADGSDTGGSLRNPASFCNVVGLRPSLGRVAAPSPYAFGRLHVHGPMGRDVRDTALLLSVMAGEDRRDPRSVPADAAAYREIAHSEPGGHLGFARSRPRVAWTPDFGGAFPVEREVLAVVEPALASMAEAGLCDVVEDHPHLSEATQVFRVLRGLLVYATLGPLVAEHGDRMKPDAAWNVQVGADLTADQIAQAELGQGRLYAATVNFFDRYDLLVTPTCQVSPFEVSTRYPRTIDGRPMRDYLEWMTLPCYLTTTAHPAISIPVGFTAGGLPVGLQVVAPFRREDLLLEYAKRIEDLVGTGHIPPDIPAGVLSEPFPHID